VKGTILSPQKIRHLRELLEAQSMADYGTLIAHSKSARDPKL